MFNRTIALPHGAPSVRFLTRELAGEYGLYEPGGGPRGGPRGGTIYINSHARADGHRVLYTVHEIAHYLDRNVVNEGPTIGSLVPGRYDPIISAADRTGSAVKWAESEMDGYLLAREEIWARAFAQWIVVRGGTQSEYDLVVSHPHHWSAEEFTAVGEAVGVVLGRLGLLRS